jgi:hypothetical protein
VRSFAGLGAGFVAVFALSGCGEPVGSSGFVDIPGIGSTRIDVPRPTGPTSAACDADPLPPASDATVAERVADLREIGLFADRTELSDAALAVEVEAAITETGGTSPDVPPGILDLAVAEQDRTRVWWRDLEADVSDGNDVYAQTVAEWGEISVGAFEPTEIIESWESPEGPVTVDYVQSGITHTLTPGYLEDWIDPGIVVGINETIADSGRRFEMYKAFDQTAFVMALTDDERRAFEARGWCFE